MAVRRGTATPTAIYRGTVPVKKVMRGTVEVWSASPYPLTGTFEIVDGEALKSHELFSHTIVEPGNFTVTLIRESGQATLYSWYLNGTTYQGQGGLTRTYTGLSVGDTISVAAAEFGTLNISGTWSIVKN